MLLGEQQHQQLCCCLDVDRPVEMTIETQTEAFMDRPPSPLFVPAKSGVDADTQVVVGELFEFDLEVLFDEPQGF